MSFTNQTTNYGLPQWIGTDKPTYLVDQNGAYQTIDTELYNANSNAATALSSASSAVEVAGTASTNAQTAIDSAATANTNANAAVVTANTALTDASSALALANSLQSQVTDLSTLIDTHYYASSTSNKTILNTVGTAISAALSDRPLTDYRYLVNIIYGRTTAHPTLDEYNIYCNWIRNNNAVCGMVTNGAAQDTVYYIDLNGNVSSVTGRAYSSSGVTITDVSENTYSDVTVKIYAEKI